MHSRAYLIHCSLGAIAQVVGYVIEAAAPPFPAFVLGYFVNGFGLALQVKAHISSALSTPLIHLSPQDAGANGYVSSFSGGTETKMGIMHAVYGGCYTRLNHCTRRRTQIQ